MRICFTLDDVIRAKTEKVLECYEKVTGKHIAIDDVTTADMSKVLSFPSKKEFQKFFYEDESFHIFAEALPCSQFLDKNFILWQVDSVENNDDDIEIEVIFANPREFNASIGFSYFFLSKIATRVREIYFPMDSSTIWDKCDVLVTADDKLLKEKPLGKKSVKIEMPYNKNCSADYTYENLDAFLKDNDILKKLDE